MAKDPNQHSPEQLLRSNADRDRKAAEGFLADVKRYQERADEMFERAREFEKAADIIRAAEQTMKNTIDSIPRLS